ncbi:MAG: hypothetical protein QGI41_10080, partial [Acidimicrobiales bacterium]|nr:hypothetical protein [Acidimicrobiales bacterium]
LVKLLDWIEGQQDGADPLTMAKIDDAYNAGVRGVERWRPGLDVRRINEVVWGFLNMCLKDDAHKTFELAPMLDGLEGWRLVVSSIHRGRDNRLASLRKLVKNPMAITKLEDVEAGIVTYDNNLRAYKACGGQMPNETDLKGDLLDSLPLEIRENLLWRSVDGDESYEKFRNHVRVQANHVLYHRGKLRGQVNAVDATTHDSHTSSPGPPGPREGPGLANHGMANVEGDLEQMLLAIVRRLNQRPGAPRQPALRNSPGGQADRPMRCVNCGGEGHMSRACTKPAAPPDKRPCFKCGKLGHLGRDCRGGGRPLKMIEDEAVPSFGGAFNLVMDADGFEEVKKARRPQPRQITVAGFIPTEVRNSWNVLSEGYANFSPPSTPARPRAGRDGDDAGRKCSKRVDLAKDLAHAENSITGPQDHDGQAIPERQDLDDNEPSRGTNSATTR